MSQLLDLFLHLDEHLRQLTADYGGWTYGILFLVVFCETGLVVTPILPGDSLLFAAGAIASLGSLNVWLLCGLLFLAAVLGDTVNYHVGLFLGPKVLSGKLSRWLNPKHLKKTEEFYARYGAMTIILARFVPIVRTFAPFVAGVGRMSYGKFLLYNILGGALWVLSMTLAGYFLGEIPFVKEHFEFIVLGLVFVSILPMVFEFIRQRYFAPRTSEAKAKM
jgi:membrane-associated protein